MNLFAIVQEAAMATAAKSAPRAPRKGAHLERMRALGLVGCIEGPADLSVNYKKYLRRALRAKYRAR
jgi:hypothetical protein